MLLFITGLVAVRPVYSFKAGGIMIKCYFDSAEIEFIFFDKGGTIGYLKENTDYSLNKVRQIMNFLGYEGSPNEFQKVLKERNKKLKNWSFNNCYEETVDDICRKWLFFDAPYFEKIINHAEELVKMNSQVKGERLMYPEASHVLKELKNRGYRTGLISNTASSTMVPEELRSAGIWNDFEVRILSADVRIKKPDPEIFLLGCRKASIQPEKCVYIGDQPDRDVEGPRKAGFAGVILLKTDAYSPENDTGPMRAPDAVVETLPDLLDIFPSRV